MSEEQNEVAHQQAAEEGRQVARQIAEELQQVARKIAARAAAGVALPVEEQFVLARAYAAHDAALQNIGGILDEKGDSVWVPREIYEGEWEHGQKMIQGVRAALNKVDMRAEEDGAYSMGFPCVPVMMCALLLREGAKHLPPQDHPGWAHVWKEAREALVGVPGLNISAFEEYRGLMRIVLAERRQFGFDEDAELEYMERLDDLYNKMTEQEQEAIEKEFSRPEAEIEE